MKHTKKKLATLLGIACFGMTVLLSPIATVTVQAAAPSAETVAPCADAINYRYKEENGKLYRRLFNYTTGSWIGDWEYVADVS